LIKTASAASTAHGDAYSPQKIQHNCKHARTYVTYTRTHTGTQAHRHTRTYTRHAWCMRNITRRQLLPEDGLAEGGIFLHPRHPCSSLTPAPSPTCVFWGPGRGLQQGQLRASPRALSCDSVSLTTHVRHVLRHKRTS
jgi:hypothetical protein